MSKNLLTIGQAAMYLNVSQDTLRRWDASGRLVALRSTGGHRYYQREVLERFKQELFSIARIWAASGVAPEVSSEYYAETQDTYRARLERLAHTMNRDPSSSTMAPLVAAITGEVGNNSFDHNLGNWPEVPGIFFGYDTNKRLIVLADRGVGIRATLSRVRPELKDDIEALTVAVTELISGRAPENRGNGLKFVRNVATQNPIGVTLQSGTAVATIEKDSPKELEVKLADQNVRGVLARIEY